MRGLGAVAAWTSPVLVIAVVARVTAGGVEAPLFVLAALAAPLLALLAGDAPRPARSGFALTIALAVVVGVLGAGFRAVTDLGELLGLDTGTALGGAAALVLVTTLWPSPHRVAATAFALGAVALLVALVMLGAATAAAPWTAWSRVATRGAFVLGARSEWTGEGARFAGPIALTFAEPHRITVAAAAVVRLTERDRGTTERERRLAAGESLLLRPDDTLSIPAGARVRFETGRRVPGTAVSGVTWAEGSGATRPRLLVWWMGLTLTLAGGALMVVRGAPPLSRVSAVLAPAAGVGVILAAACWGVYAVEAAPELSIGVPPVAVLTRLAPVVADEPWRSRLLGAIVVAPVALFLGAAAALRQRLVDLVGEERAPVAPSRRRRLLEHASWLLAVAAAAAVAMVADGWSLLWHGAGLAAATLLGPLVATRQTPDHDGARAKGALAGALMFIALAALARLPAALGSLDVIAQAPALVAAPVAWLITRLSRPPNVRA